jgi:heme-degrading monooxygenase HmoA
MVVEYIRYRIQDSGRKAFQEAYRHAEGPLKQSKHCLGYEIAQCVEDQNYYTVRIEWDSLEGHEKGFRMSPEFGPFLEAVRPFIPNIEEMRHYEVIPAKTS